MQEKWSLGGTGMPWREFPGSGRGGKDAWQRREESGALSERSGESAPGEIPEGCLRPDLFAP